MNIRTGTEHLSEAVVRATEHWHARRQERSTGSTARACTIALSRQAGARGTSVARELGRRLGWPVYDQELLKQISQELGLRENLVASVDERHVSWLGELLSSLFTQRVISESGYVHRLIETVASLSAHGHCIIVGRGAPFLLPAESTLRVRLVAPLADRIEVMSREFNVSRAEAEKRVRDLDRDREAFVREYFAKDATDPVHYDLVLNISRYTVAECADLISAGLEPLRARLEGAVP